MTDYSNTFVMLCEVCGNPMPSIAVFCPYCKSRQDEQKKLRGKARCTAVFRRKVVNLEHGLPLLEIALQRLDNAVLGAKQENVTVLTLIHGYGSSGKGGIIREECRKMLDYMQTRGEIRSFLPGEDFCKRSGVARDYVRRYPQLAKDRNYNHSNKGITLVFL